MNSKQLKILALISMLFDHFIRIFPLSDAIVPVADRFASIGLENLSIWIMSWVPHVLMYFGRVAAPVFMFCIVEGFLHTTGEFGAATNLYSEYTRTLSWYSGNLLLFR